MNRVFLIGNLTHDPELGQSASGTTFCRFSIAVNRPYTQGDGERGVDFFNCTAWSKLAENVARYLKKGSKIAVEGSIQIRNYEDNSGNRKTAVDVLCSIAEFLPSAKSNAIDDDAPVNTASERPKKQMILQDFDDDENCPF